MTRIGSIMGNQFRLLGAEARATCCRSFTRQASRGKGVVVTCASVIELVLNASGTKVQNGSLKPVHGKGV